MRMEEPRIEFVPIDMDEIVTSTSYCTTAETQASMATCDCTNGLQYGIPGNSEEGCGSFM